MPTKIEASLTHAQFEEFCQKLLELPGKARTLAGVQSLASEYGITVSPMGAKAFKDGPFARHLEKLNRGRETREALVAAAGAGVHPLDALEEATVMELQDHLTEAETIDVNFLSSQLVKLRTSISMREDTKRKDRDFDRKLRETEKKLEIAAEQLAKLQREKTEWEEERAKIRATAEAAGAAINKPKASPDEIRAQTVALIDEIMGIKPKKA
jgi:chromosome segregation ATPase